ncbi:uncharacterized protein TNCV_3099691 [Trichonephila clavipes]|nr:uncharacterized protein TNCV_3099691 [Trichonephila clavipes]
MVWGNIAYNTRSPVVLIRGTMAAQCWIKSRGIHSRAAAFGDESPCRATVFRWFKEFCSGHNSLPDEEHIERPRSTVIPDNLSAIRKMLMDDNRCTYQLIQKELNFGSAAICKIIHEELRMKKVACHWVPHNLTEHHKKELVRISEKIPSIAKRWRPPHHL